MTAGISNHYHLVQDLKKRFPFAREDDLKRMVEIEADRQRDHSRFMGGRACSYDVAYQRAHKSIGEWISGAHEYVIDLSNLDELASFVASHGTACVWGVIVGKAHLPKPVAP